MFTHEGKIRDTFSLKIDKYLEPSLAAKLQDTGNPGQDHLPPAIPPARQIVNQPLQRQIPSLPVQVNGWSTSLQWTRLSLTGLQGFLEHMLTPRSWPPGTPAAELEPFPTHHGPKEQSSHHPGLGLGRPSEPHSWPSTNSPWQLPWALSCSQP